MENFDLMKEVCEKIASVAIDIGEMDLTISKLQDKGYSESAELYVEMQLSELDQLHKLVLFLTGLLIPQDGEKEDEDESEMEEVEIPYTPEREDVDDDEKIDEAKAKKLRALYANSNRVIPAKVKNAKPVSRKAGIERGKYAK